MNKPERVEAGQWRVWCAHDGGAPFRVTEGMLSDAVRLADHSMYLGSGEHPEPSDWMIETLAEHAWNSRGDDIEWDELGLEFKNRIRLSVRALVSGDSGDPFEWNATVMSLYRILRSLGKW